MFESIKGPLSWVCLAIDSELTKSATDYSDQLSFVIQLIDFYKLNDTGPDADTMLTNAINRLVGDVDE